MATILVTGAAGFIGSHTVDRLLLDGHQVVGLDNLRTGNLANLANAMPHPGFRFIPQDVLDAVALRDIFSQVRPEAIVHLAALVSVPESIAHPELNRSLNYDATLLVAKAAQTIGNVRRLVYASSAAVYGANPHLPLDEDAECRPLSPYGQAKLDSERWLQSFSVESNAPGSVCLRFFNVFGARQDPRSPYSGVISRFADALRRGDDPVVHGDGEQTRDFIAVTEVARAVSLACVAPNVPNRSINICTGNAVTLNSLLAAMARELKCELQIAHAPTREGDIRHSRGAPNRAQTLLGFKADSDLAAGLRAMFQS